MRACERGALVCVGVKISIAASVYHSYVAMAAATPAYCSMSVVWACNEMTDVQIAPHKPTKSEKFQNNTFQFLSSDDMRCVTLFFS